jgi:glycosyltransferase involved in cell wall biosynthesis
MTQQKIYKPVPIFEQQWEENSTPLVSISCVTYNHASYIREALDSFLMQKTTFPVEILIYDDASTDGAVEIIKEYESKFSTIIFPIYQSQNQFLQGIRGMMTRFNFPRARGKYIALCEGDDYWTDPLKLQKQVDFLEGHPSYSGAAHQSLMVFTDEIKKEPKLFNDHTITDIEVNHLLEDRLFHTASLIFRSEITVKHQLPTNITAGDRALFFLLTAYGKIYYSQEVMCCYRKHTEGMSNWVTTEMLEKDLKIIPWISKINPTFPKYRYYQFLHLIALKYPNTLSILKIIKHSLLYIYYTFLVSYHIFRDLKIFIKQDVPSFFKKVRS